MAKIDNILAREILDSRGFPTVEAKVILDDGSCGVSSVPTGTTIGSFEAVELRDKDPNRYSGMGVLKAVAGINEKICRAMIGVDVNFQNQIDQNLLELDGSGNKSNFGANAILAVSQASLKAAAASFHLPVYKYLWAKYQLSDQNTALPTSVFNMINGGSHGTGNLDFQEFLLVPSSRYSFSRALEIGVEIYQSLRHSLARLHASNSLGDDGGFTPNFMTNLDALQMILDVVSKTPYQFNTDVFLSLDVAASYFYKNGHYQIKDRAQAFSREEFINYFEELNRQYHILLLEDPLYEDDWEGWKNLTSIIGDKVIILGDDLLCTNISRVKKAIDTKACNGILLKPNQIGTVTETLQVVKLCKENNWQIMVSHRGGETNDDFIADLAVGVGASYTKFGAPARGERVAKYNRLMEIEAELSKK